MPESPYGFWYPPERGKSSEPEEVSEVEETSEISPRLEIDTPEGILIITPANTVLRKFEEGEGEFDHIIHNLAGTEQSIAIFLEGEDPAMREHFETNPYMTYTAVRPNDEVYGYYAAAVVKGMDHTIEP